MGLFWGPGVEEDAIEAGVIEADSLLMVLEEGVHGGPPEMGWVSPTMIARSAGPWGVQWVQPLA